MAAAEGAVAVAAAEGAAISTIVVEGGTLISGAFVFSPVGLSIIAAGVIIGFFWWIRKKPPSGGGG